MSCKSVHLTMILLLPMAFAMTLDTPKLTLAVSDAPKLTLAAVDAPKITLAVAGSDVKELSKMETVFARSEEVHKQYMAKFAATLLFPQAMTIMKNGHSAQRETAYKQVTGLITGSQNLRAHKEQKKDEGFGGIDGARRLLNDMIHESMTKYDAEIAKCTDYYAKQCALMEVARGQISASNFIAASSRGLILDAQAVINRMEKDIPATKQELKDHNTQCKGEMKKLNERLKAIMGDIAVMTMILKMSDCESKKGLVQMNKLAMLRCEDQCTKQGSVTFNHNGLQKEFDELKSPASRDMIASTFADLFADSEDDVEFVQVAGSDYQAVHNVTNKTKFNRPPVPRTKVPSNPCTDPNKGAPSSEDKRAAKCTLKKSPNCYKLQGRFLQIQAGIADDRDQLMDDIEKYQETCQETKKSLEASIENDGSSLSSSQTKLAAATEKEASAGEMGRQIAKENEAYNSDLVKQMTTCSGNYVSFEQELCALKKIRGDLFKKMVKGHKGFFQDCEVSKWTPEACTKVCAGGEQKIGRAVLTHPSGGAKCLPLAAMRKCNRSPCPVNCKLESWSGWSKCSSKCGGGLATRVRDVKQPMQYDGKPCSATSQAKQCNVDACEKDCVLREWTKWTGCSKDCDGGSKKRERMIKEPAQGAGKCAGQWSEERLQYENCNVHRCKVPDSTKVMKCNQTFDIVLVMDGTPKSGKAGWLAEQTAANQFVDAFTGEGVTAKPNFAVVHYTGPRTWTGVSKCTGKSTAKVDMEKTCKIKIAQHFEEDTKKVKGIISGLAFTPGSKLLSLGLMTVQAEMALGRSTARSIVVVFIDGQPLSYRKTKIASHTIRKKARLIYVVTTKFAPLAAIKTWASRRWQENIVQVASSEELALPETGTHVIANICPKKFPKLKMKKGR